jgi:hypothetical protein
LPHLVKKCLDMTVSHEIVTVNGHLFPQALATRMQLTCWKLLVRLGFGSSVNTPRECEPHYRKYLKNSTATINH